MSPRAVLRPPQAASDVAVDALPTAVVNPVAFITGATSDGIGFRVAQRLLGAGYDIITVARSTERAARLKQLQEQNPGGRVHIYYCDCSLTGEIKRLATEVLAAHPQIDVMINSLGVMTPRRTMTSENLEENVVVNAIAPWMLARLLLPALRRSGHGRVIQLNSDGHDLFAASDQREVPSWLQPARLMSKAIRVGKAALENARGPQPAKKARFNLFGDYGAAKLTALHLNFELAKRLTAEGIPVHVNSVHPGQVDTELGRHMADSGPGWMRPVWQFGQRVHAMNAMKPDAAARPIVALATEPMYSEDTGAYFAGDKKVLSSSSARDAAVWQATWDTMCDLAHLPHDIMDDLA